MGRDLIKFEIAYYGLNNMTNSTVETGAKTGLTWQVMVLAGPLVLQNLSQTLLGVIDTFFVSRISTDALAAVGLAGVMFFALLMLFRGTAMSTVVFVGRAHGEGDDAKVGFSVWRSLHMIGWLSLFAFALPFVFTALMSVAAPDDGSAVRELGTQYLRILSFEVPMIMFSSVVWGFLVGRGDSRTPMILAWVTVLLNIALDWVLVLGNLGFPALGVAGAAYATVIANGVNMVLSGVVLWLPHNRKQFGTGLVRWVSWSEIKAGFAIGLPMGAGDFIDIASFSVFFAMLARLGSNILAANQIALQYMSVSFTFGMAISMASSSLVSQYLGSKEPDLAEKAAYRGVMIAVLGMAVIGLSYLIAPARLIGFFSEDETVIEAGVTILRLIAVYQVFDGVGIVLSGALNGAGDTRFTMVGRMILAWGMFLPLAWLMIFRLDMGVWGAWSAALAYLGGLALIFFFRFRSGHWKTIEVG